MQAQLVVDQGDGEHGVVDAQDLDQCARSDRGAQLVNVELADRRTTTTRMPRTVPHGLLEAQLFRTQLAGVFTVGRRLG